MAGVIAALLVFLWLALSAFGVARAITRRAPSFPLSPARRFAERVARPFARRLLPGPDGDRPDTARVDLPEAVDDGDGPDGGGEPIWPTLGDRELLERLGVDPERALTFAPGTVEAEMWARVLDTRAYRHALAPFLRGVGGARFAVHRGDLVIATPEAARRPALSQALREQAQSYAEPLAERLRTLPERLLTPGPFIHGDVARTYPVEAVLLAYAGTVHAEKAMEMLGHWVQSPAKAEPERVRALELLARHAPSERLAPVVALALRRGSDAVTRLAFAVAGEGRCRLSVEALEQAAARPQYAALLLSLLAQRPLRDDEDSERVLLAIVRGGASGNAAVEAVERLGAVGGARSAQALAALQVGPTRTGGALGRALDAAIARIQSRIDGVVAGGLSVVEDGADHGGLSLAEVEGAVSLVESDD